MASATEVLKTQVGLSKKPITFQEMLESMRPQIAAALPRFLNPDRMIRIALTSMRLNPKLAECTPDSLLASIMIASQLGLEPGIRGQAYLVPYFNSKSKKLICQLIPGWMGILDLVNRTGKAQAWTGAVYKGDEFDWALGDKPFVTHRPCGDETTLTHAYAVARTNSQWPVIEVWNIEKIWKHRNKINKVGDSHYSYAWPDQYAKKVPLLQVLKYVPQSVELRTALSLDDAAETGGQSYGIKDVPSIIEGSIVPDEAPEFSDDRGGVAAPAKAQDEICGSCGWKNGHESTCKFAAKPSGVSTATVEPSTASNAPQQPANRLAVRIMKVITRTKKPLRIIEVLTDAGPVDMNVWHEHFHPILDGLQKVIDDGSKQVGMAVIEYSEKEKDGRIWSSLEKIIELDGVPLNV